jgi:thiamine-phosphate pyrophosphorylase
MLSRRGRDLRSSNMAANGKKAIDYSLYLVTDRSLSLGRSNLEIIKAAIDGGVTMVQLREKHIPTKEFYHEAIEIKEYLGGKGIPLIINDRIDIALAVDADGVHIGQEDMPLRAARHILGPDKIIGVSVFTVDEARAAEAAGADYLGLSPILVTSTKPELTRQIGIAGIAPIRAAVRIPLVGIGSMNSSNAFEAVNAGLDGLAVVSGIVSQNDITVAARAIKAEVMRAKGLFLDGIGPGEL